MSMSTQNIVQFISNSSPDFLSTEFDRLLQHTSPQERLSQFIYLFSSVTGFQDRLDSVVKAAWDYFVENEIWKPQFSTLTSFQESIDYYKTVHPAIERAKTNVLRATRI